MGAKAVESLIYFVCGGLLMYTWLWIRHAWTQRRQLPRRDVPTGHEPWIKPQPKVRR